MGGRILASLRIAIHIGIAIAGGVAGISATGMAAGIIANIIIADGPCDGCRVLIAMAKAVIADIAASEIILRHLLILILHVIGGLGERRIHHLHLCRCAAAHQKRPRSQPSQ